MLKIIIKQLNFKFLDINSGFKSYLNNIKKILYENQIKKNYAIEV